MSFIQRELFKQKSVTDVTNREAQFLLSQRNPFEARPQIKHSNLAYAA